VLFDSNLEGVGSAFVGSDNPQFTTLMVDYLCRTGEAPTFFEIEAAPNPNANRRRNAYLATMEQLGHEPDVVSVEGQGWDFEGIGFERGREMLGDRRLATNTVLCSNDRLAIGLIAAAYDCNIRVGHKADCQLRIAGQDDHPFSRFTCPPLTTIAQDYDAISAKSLETLLEFIDGGMPDGGRQDTLFQGRLVMRASA
ncbi:MAG: LacI family DNA-binding transcriptional regulator, partial [Pseudomonadota bacterium]